MKTKIILIATIAIVLIIISFFGFGYYSLRKADNLVKEQKINEAVSMYEKISQLPFFQIAKEKLNSLMSYKDGLEAFNNHKCKIANEELAKVSEKESYFEDANKKIEECEKYLEYAIIVNNNLITLEEFKEAYDYVIAYYKFINYSLDNSRKKEMKKDITNSLIRDEIIREEVKKRGIEISSKEVDDKYQQYLKENNGEKQLMDNLKKTYNWGLEEFKEQIKKQLLREKLENVIKKENKNFDPWLSDLVNKADIKKNQLAIDSL
ncbi:hypothetical protein COX95_01780 [bacterium CG_4_10_14_0_2_um_filter_33_32]|nr:MAG: hypothetical protein COY76_03875 [bacterium CG_4_10_14_0_8_um_filter_33_57]PIZ86255.1 MAG: hypothetical protein COX95_01780 [bacterium CG_4_10_14_0_2_um_filter_33_32]